MPLVPPPPHHLPKPATAATTSTWLLGTRHGFREVPAARARLIARRLGDRLTFAEPNVARHLDQRAVPDDPLTPLSRWRDRIIDPALTPPAPTVLLALVDAKADITHPEFAGANVTSLTRRKVRVSHGTATLGVAAAPVNGVGIVGAYPGARAVNVALPPNGIRCADSARGIRRAITAGARVISMSYGSAAFCQAEYEALQLATRRDITLVAAGGNERTRGNPYEFPASLPHVITVGALTARDRPAFFSNANAALDLVAPGVGIVVPVPPDRYASYDGTSFSTPMVAAAATWLRTVRPDLTADQVTAVLRASATDVGAAGYDLKTGYGRLDLAKALLQATPPADPLEPNEDFRFVDGRTFEHAARPIWTGGAAASLTATVDLFEDPSDVYRIRVPGHRRVTITLRPTGNADLDVYAGGSPTVASDRGLIRRSRHTGTRPERVRIRNAGGRTRTALIQVYQRGRRPANSGYTLTVT